MLTHKSTSTGTDRLLNITINALSRASNQPNLVQDAALTLQAYLAVQEGLTVRSEKLAKGISAKISNENPVEAMMKDGVSESLSSWINVFLDNHMEMPQDS